MLKENGIPYLRPDDYLAEMMKDDKKMKMIEKRKETIEEEKKQKLRQVIIRNKNKKRSNRKKYSRRSLPCSNKHSKAYQKSTSIHTAYSLLTSSKFSTSSGTSSSAGAFSASAAFARLAAFRYCPRPSWLMMPGISSARATPHLPNSFLLFSSGLPKIAVVLKLGLIQAIAHYTSILPTRTLGEVKDLTVGGEQIHFLNSVNGLATDLLKSQLQLGVFNSSGLVNNLLRSSAVSLSTSSSLHITKTVQFQPRYRT